MYDIFNIVVEADILPLPGSVSKCRVSSNVLLEFRLIFDMLDWETNDDTFGHLNVVRIKKCTRGKHWFLGRHCGDICLTRTLAQYIPRHFPRVPAP
jgi:hypothetical protein